ncbi:kinase-like domain-containing protein [Auriculariales sp. MPI-PUGE-AT-0066]|nr:kinase-like domain-containing protein [Auriculariales sp. MPI-PUGE-AT-0066]
MSRVNIAEYKQIIQRNVYDMFDLGKVEFVAAGGEGVVFRAPSRWNGKFKAIKISQLDAAESLMQEGELVKQIFADGPETPCIAQVQEIIQDDIFGQTILISEFYHLGSLRSWLNRECGADGRPRYDIVENFLHDTVRGLMHLHLVHGIVHRDIKPDNLLVKQHSNRDLSVEITDLGWHAPSLASTSSSASFSSTADTLGSFDAQYIPMYEATEYLDRSLNLHGASPTGTQATIVPSNSAVDVFNGFKFKFFQPSIVDLEPTVALAYVPGAFDISNALFLR